MTKTEKKVKNCEMYSVVTIDAFTTRAYSGNRNVKSTLPRANHPVIFVE